MMTTWQRVLLALCGPIEVREGWTVLAQDLVMRGAEKVVQDENMRKQIEILEKYTSPGRL